VIPHFTFLIFLLIYCQVFPEIAKEKLLLELRQDPNVTLLIEVLERMEREEQEGRAIGRRGGE
jgi:hypothetical protein